ncbi:MAG: hypothetical protein A2942_04695 [Candidatus Lloydbacteria bacterium RIFCSPLOWO2_01_FULL_50_20]|uniref:Uncharacterized protein n=1 Tax=Candidatus Lloydbacteria bacterium RIFCSPLOWO2_01_FULL_50_20 TaxID=1798665 RepID=A0A1G2DIX0_9BACT|nr:MAG: hypothetical protein A3C13_03555 [Candidatus Lloydbacteria bacterium RIFCSPHIGHO2_02_FULL_50_11]OGZ13614.1 MAG: hypothetical protein A2942_04695 [Candidatus Lloydbacteria bacterium RIFCSPLOWO2_01_FULL_50_20]
MLAPFVHLSASSHLGIFESRKNILGNKKAPHTAGSERRLGRRFAGFEGDVRPGRSKNATEAINTPTRAGDRERMFAFAATQDFFRRGCAVTCPLTRRAKLLEI